MTQIRLDERLATAARLVRRDGVAADIGTDHGMLACYLAQTGQKRVMASDINPLPLEAARATAELYGVDGVELVLSDGLDGIPYADDVIIAGMGGELISAIMSKCAFLSENTRFILQPMTKHETLRRSLYAMGFEIICELGAEVRGKHYTVIHSWYTGVKREIDDYFAFVGKCDDAGYIGEVLSRLEKMALGNAGINAVIEKIKSGFGL